MIMFLFASKSYLLPSSYDDWLYVSDMLTLFPFSLLAIFYHSTLAVVFEELTTIAVKAFDSYFREAQRGLWRN